MDELKRLMQQRESLVPDVNRVLLEVDRRTGSRARRRWFLPGVVAAVTVLIAASVVWFSHADRSTPSPATPSPATPSPATPSPETPSPATPSPATSTGPETTSATPGNQAESDGGIPGSTATPAITYRVLDSIKSPGVAPPAGTGKEFLNSAEAQIYADGQKIDPRTAAQRLDLMDDMGALDEKMTAVAGERYAGSWIDNEDFGFVFQLSGAGEIPSRLLDLAREAPFPTSVETTDKPSAGDIARFRDAHDDLLTDLVTNLQGIGDDVHTGQIVLDRHGDSDSTRYLTVTDPDSGLVIVVRVETGTAVASDGSAPIDSNLSTTGPR